MKSNPEYNQFGYYREKFDQIYQLVHKELFAEDAIYKTIDYPANGVTAYFSRNFTDDDHEILDKFLA